MSRLTTPAQTEGPFYPLGYRLEEGNILNQRKDEFAQGESIIVAGHVVNIHGLPLENVLIEIWQADSNGRYDHPGDNHNPNALDPNFQYWGKTITDNTGQYFFETIKPAPYNDDGDWRTAHIHFKIYLKRNTCALTTQLYFAGEKLNSQDNHLASLSQDKQQLLLTTPKPKGQKYGFPANTVIHEFNIILDE